MEKKTYYTPEELEELLKKAQEEAEAALDKLTPEERRQAEIDGKKLMEEDMAAKQKILDEAAKFVEEHSEKKSEGPKFCTNCGARIRGGKFCENCGSRL